MRIRELLLACMTTILIQSMAAQTTPTREQQIAAAVLPLPENSRSNATVVSYGPNDSRVTLRKGSNGLVCETDRPNDDQFYVNCWPEPIFTLLTRARELRRELRAKGAPADQNNVDQAIEKEIRDGKLKLPSNPTVAFRMRVPSSGYDWASNKPSGEIKRWEMVIIPHATGASLSLPTQRQGSMPWVMGEGSWLAHIMIEH